MKRESFKKMSKPFIDYYTENKISPVSQDISDIDRHFERRSALYRLCGLPPMSITGKRVLELGPGTGHNALFTNSLSPDEYVLVDGNVTSIQETTDLLKKHFKDITNCKIVHSDIELFFSDEKFDVVFCEDVIPFQKKSKTFFTKCITICLSRGSIIDYLC